MVVYQMVEVESGMVEVESGMVEVESGDPREPWCSGSLRGRSTLRLGRRLGAASMMVVAVLFSACGSTSTVTNPPPGGETPGASASAGESPSEAPSPSVACTQGGKLTFARQEEPTSLVPWISTGNGNIFFQMQIYDQLVEQLPGQADPQPGLAESWDVSPDSLTYTFHLRDSKFSNGDPVTVDDVKFSMDRMIDPEVHSDWLFLMGNIKNFEVVDDKTIQMNMKAIDASILYSLTLPAGSIYSKKVFDAMGQKAFEKAPVGSGAFMLKSQTLGQNVEVVRNPNYWRSGQPYLDDVNFLYIPDSNARTLKVQSGEADIAEAIPYEQVDQVNATNGVKVQIEPKMVGWYVILNNKVKPFDEKAVRQALNYAAPKDVINDTVLAGLGTVSNSMIVQNGRFWDSTVDPYPYDLAKAKQLLSQSSVPNGFSLELILNKDLIQSIQAAEILQQEWAKIGVNVKITKLDSAIGWERLTKGDYQAEMDGPITLTSDSLDDNEIASIFLDYSDAWKSWWSGYTDDESSRLVREANATVDIAKRQELYAQLQRHAMEDAPWVTLLNAPTTNAVADKVKGFHALPVGWWRLENVCLGQ